MALRRKKNDPAETQGNNEFDIIPTWDEDAPAGLDVSAAPNRIPVDLLTGEKVSAVRFQNSKPGYDFRQVETFVDQVVRSLAYFESAHHENSLILHAANEEIDELRAQVTDLRATIEVFRAKGDPMVDAQGDYVTASTLAATSPDSEYLRQQLADANGKLEYALSEIDRLSTENTHLHSAASNDAVPGADSGAFERLQAQVDEAWEAEAELRAWVDDNMANWEQLKNEANRLNAELTQARAELAHKQRAVESSESRVAELESAIAIGKTTIADLQEQVAELSTATPEEDSVNPEALATEHAARVKAETDLEVATAALESLKVEHLVSVEGLQAELVEQKGLLDEASAEAAAALARCDDYEKALAVSLEEKAAAERQLENQLRREKIEREERMKAQHAAAERRAAAERQRAAWEERMRSTAPSPAQASASSAKENPEPEDEGQGANEGDARTEADSAAEDAARAAAEEAAREAQRELEELRAAKQAAEEKAAVEEAARVAAEAAAKKAAEEKAAAEKAAEKAAAEKAAAEKKKRDQAAAAKRAETARKKKEAEEAKLAAEQEAEEKRAAEQEAAEKEAEALKLAAEEAAQEQDSDGFDDFDAEDDFPEEDPTPHPPTASPSGRSNKSPFASPNAQPAPPAPVEEETQHTVPLPPLLASAPELSGDYNLKAFMDDLNEEQHKE